MANQFSKIFLIGVLICAILNACSGRSNLDNLRTAMDQGGQQLSTVFSKSDAVYVIADLANGTVGDKVSAKWYAQDVRGIEPDFLLDQTDIVVEQSGSYSLHFDFVFPASGWLEGKYMVEVYLNDALIDVVFFQIQ